MQNYGWNKAPRGWHDVRWRDMWDDVMCGVTWCHRSNLTEQNARQVYKGHGGKETEPSVKTLWPKAPKKEALQHWAVVYDLFVLLGNKSVGYIFSSLRWKKNCPTRCYLNLKLWVRKTLPALWFHGHRKATLTVDHLNVQLSARLVSAQTRIRQIVVDAIPSSLFGEARERAGNYLSTLWLSYFHLECAWCAIVSSVRYVGSQLDRKQRIERFGFHWVDQNKNLTKICVQYQTTKTKQSANPVMRLTIWTGKMTLFAVSRLLSHT